MGPRSVNPKIRKPEKPDPNDNGYPNAQTYSLMSMSIMLPTNEIDRSLEHLAGLLAVAEDYSKVSY